jgi:hypothetical protein
MTQNVDLSMEEFFNFADASYQEHLPLTETSGVDSDHSMLPSPQSSDEKYEVINSCYEANADMFHLVIFRQRFMRLLGSRKKNLVQNLTTVTLQSGFHVFLVRNNLVLIVDHVI